MVFRPWWLRIGRWLIPRSLRPTLGACAVLAFRYGHLRSVRERACVDRQGAPIPWLTYPAWEYLEHRDFSSCRIFEYGAGASTEFWLRRARSVVAVEHDRRWYRKLTDRLSGAREHGLQLILAEDPSDYACVIEDCSPPFDVIVIDGLNRLGCAEQAVRHLAPGGLVILDDSEWYHRSAAFLASQGLLQVDMAGFKPLSRHTSTTSFFFDRSFELPTLSDRAVARSLAGLDRRPEG